MKKFIYILTIVFSATIITNISCSKENKNIPVKEYSVSYFTDKFLKDTSFAEFFKYSLNNSFKINGIFGKDNFSSKNNDLPGDTTAAYDFIAEIATAEVLMRQAHPNFFMLPSDEQLEVINNICDTLADATYRYENSTNLLVSYAIETYEYVIQNGPIIVKGNNFLDITWNEFMGCTTALLGAVISEYGGVVGEIWGLVSGTSMTWGNIWNIAKRLVRNAVPWYKVIGATIAYAGCLWYAGS